MEAVQITPEPGEAERKAILEALAAEQDGRPTPSRWSRALLPSREGEEDEP